MDATIRYSEAFKLQVIRELEEGKFENQAAAARAYGIRGRMTIRQWIEKYGRTQLLKKVIRVQKPEEINEVKQLRKQIRDLKDALADSHLDLKIEQAYLRIACRTAGIDDLEDFKKKHAGIR